MPAAAFVSNCLQTIPIANLDATIICERPKLSPHKELMRMNIASALGVHEQYVNLKGKTHEQVDAVGRNEAIEVHCVVLLYQKV